MGDKLEPWTMPCSTLNVSDFSSSKSKTLLEDSYIFLITRHILPFTPISLNLYHNSSCHRKSQAFCITKKNTYMFSIFPQSVLHNFIESVHIIHATSVSSEASLSLMQYPSLSKHCTNLFLRNLQNTFLTTLSKDL